MKRIAQFYKVSQQQFQADFPDCGADPDVCYQQLQLPRRATAGSAGYDFFAPFDISLAPGETAKIPTGIRARIAEGWVLLLCPRSGQGMKYRLQLNNNLGVIDSDYFDSDNEGHIQARIINDSRDGKVLFIPAGTGFMQGIFTEFGITEEDEATAVRNGGFGSTDRA